MPHSPNWFSAFALPYVYAPNAECTRWYEFLDQVFDGDDERVDLLGEFFGLCLTSETRYQRILVLQGPRRAGKGTILRQLCQTVGEANCIVPRLSTLGELSGLAGLLGKRVALCADAHLGRGDDALGVLEVLKSISGEDSIEIHRKNLPSINARLRIRFVLGVNDFPRFGDSAGAISSRLLVISFRNSWEGREDCALEEKIKSETPGILNWAIDGLRRLRQNSRFTVPAASAKVTSEFRRLSSPVTAFLEDCCTVTPAGEVERDALYSAWRDWCARAGHVPGSREVFGARLRTPDRERASAILHRDCPN